MSRIACPSLDKCSDDRADGQAHAKRMRTAGRHARHEDARELTLENYGPGERLGRRPQGSIITTVEGACLGFALRGRSPQHCDLDKPAAAAFRLEFLARSQTRSRLDPNKKFEIGGLQLVILGKWRG